MQDLETTLNVAKILLMRKHRNLIILNLKKKKISILTRIFLIKSLYRFFFESVYKKHQRHLLITANEPRHDKTNKMSVRLAKTQISLSIRPVWSESSQCAKLVAKDPNFLHADNKDSDQTGRMPRLIWVFAGRACHFVGFVMRRHVNSCHTYSWGVKRKIIKIIYWFSGQSNFSLFWGQCPRWDRGVCWDR